MPKYIVGEYMRRHVPTIARNGTLGEAIKILLKEQVNGLIVVDDKNPSKVAGIIASRDVVSMVVPDYLEAYRMLANFEPRDMFVKRVKEVEQEPVENFMTENVHVVREDDSLMKLVTLLCEHGIQQLPVVDTNGNLTGYISRTDIKQALSDAMDDSHRTSP